MAQEHKEKFHPNGTQIWYAYQLNRHGASMEFEAVQDRHCCLGVFSTNHGDECKATRLAGMGIQHDLHLLYL